MTTEERMTELAESVWEEMDLKVVEVFVLETLIANYKEHPNEFEENWKNYMGEA